MTNGNTVRFEIDQDRLVERCVESLMTGDYYGGDWDYDDDTRFAARMRDLIEKTVRDRVTTELDAQINEALRTRVAGIIEEVTSQGFPTFDRYGERTETVPFNRYVREALDSLFARRSSYDRETEATAIAKKAFDEHVRKAFSDEVETVRKKVREYVDEQLSGAVVKALREAVGLRG